MNAGQQRFYSFVMERVKEECAEEAKAMMLENFKRQDEGTFTREYMQQNAPKLLSYIKPEFIEDLQKAAAHMSATLGK